MLVFIKMYPNQAHVDLLPRDMLHRTRTTNRDSHLAVLSNFVLGDRVWMQHHSTKKWYKTAIITEIWHSGKAYEVRDSPVNTYVRGRPFLCLDGRPTSGHSCAEIKSCTLSPIFHNSHPDLLKMLYPKLIPKTKEKLQSCSSWNFGVWYAGGSCFHISQTATYVLAARAPRISGRAQTTTGWRDRYRSFPHLVISGDGVSTVIIFVITILLLSLGSAGLWFLWQCIKDCNRGSDNEHAPRKRGNTSSISRPFQTNRRKSWRGSPNWSSGSRSSSTIFSQTSYRSWTCWRDIIIGVHFPTWRV